MFILGVGVFGIALLKLEPSLFMNLRMT